MPYADTEERREYDRNYRRKKYKENPHPFRKKSREWQRKKRAEDGAYRELHNRRQRDYLRDLPSDKKMKLAKDSRRRALNRDYNLTLEEFDKILESHGGVCAICGKDEWTPRGRASVDHDHKTGNVRGLLCFKCNLGIGHLQDDPTIVAKALEYLVRYGATGR